MNLGPFQLYRDDIPGYMCRWVFETPVGMVRVHKLLRADNDPELHTHPFSFLSFILRGGYEEEIPAKGAAPNQDEPRTYRKRYAPAINFCRRGTAHRLEKVLPNTWTLVFTTSRSSSWGFWAKEGFIDYRDFFSAKEWSHRSHIERARSKLVALIEESVTGPHPCAKYALDSLDLLIAEMGIENVPRLVLFIDSEESLTLECKNDRYYFLMPFTVDEGKLSGSWHVVPIQASKPDAYGSIDTAGKWAHLCSRSLEER